MRKGIYLLCLIPFVVACRHETSGPNPQGSSNLLLRSVRLDTVQGQVSFDSTVFSYDAGNKLILEKYAGGYGDHIRSSSTNYERDANGGLYMNIPITRKLKMARWSIIPRPLRFQKTYISIPIHTGPTAWRIQNLMRPALRPGIIFSRQIT